MKKHTIVEIEEGALTVTVGGGDRNGKAVHITTCERVPLREANRDTVEAALRAIAPSAMQAGQSVHVIVGDRRAHHFLVEVPRMRSDEAIQVVLREGMRVSGVSVAKELLLVPRLLRCQPGGGLSIGAVTLPTEVWQPLQAAFAASGVEVAGLHTMESCLARAASHLADDAAVLECSHGRARFVLCDAGAPVRVRRFILAGGSDAGVEALVAQLALELPRTFDWIRESGNAQPTVMVLGNRLQVEGDALEMLRGDLERLERPPVDCEIGDGATMPGLATLMLVRQLAGGEAIPSLLDTPKIRVPWRRSSVAAIAAAAIAGVALSWTSVENFAASRAADNEAAVVDQERVEFEQELVVAESVAAPMVETALKKRHLDHALSMRRPVSRLIAEVSNCAAEAIHVGSMQFASTASVSIEGVAKGVSRKSALEALTSFVNRLRTLPYLEPDGRDEVSEVPGESNCLRFRLVLSWGKP